MDDSELPGRMMTPAIPATFESTVFPEISILANPNFKPDSAVHVVSEPIDSKISVEPIPDEKNKFAAELRVKMDARNRETIPYSFNIVCITILTVEDIIPEDQRKSFATAAAHIMAFPAVRELILTLTARQPWGQFSIGLSSLRQEEQQTPRKSPTPVEKKTTQVRKKKPSDQIDARAKNSMTRKT